MYNNHMKKTLTIVAITALLSVGLTAFALVGYTYVESKNGAVITNNYFDETNQKVFRFQDTVGKDTVTCYTFQGKVSPTSAVSGYAISCVK